MKGRRYKFQQARDTKIDRMIKAGEFAEYVKPANREQRRIAARINQRKSAGRDSGGRHGA